MFAVIYRFDVKPDQQKDFTEAWEQLTHLIYTHEGSLGSRLHHEQGNCYIAYAQWPSRKRWEDAGDHLPPEADKWRQQMKKACTSIETLHTLELTSDQLKDHAKE